MPQAPLSSREPERLQVLQGLAILDSPAEPALDQITRHVAETLDFPVVLISLVDEERQWFKACVGLDTRETSRESSFCAYTILSEEPLEIADATQDERTQDNPLVTGAPHIRAYLGYPLHVRGQNIGSLCIIDFKPREFSQREHDVVRLATKWVQREVELRDRTSLVEQRDRAAQRSHDLFYHAPLPLIAMNSDGTVGELNQAAERLWESIGDGLLRDHLSLGRIGESTIESILEQVGRVGFLSSLDPIRLETPDGGAFYLQPAVVADPNNSTGLLLGFIDQTELVLASRAWTDATERERVVRSEAFVEERQFMARLAHEMRNAVNGMVGLVDLWTREEISPTSEQMDLMRASVTTLKGLVDDTLDYDQLSRGAISLERKPFNLERVCNDLALTAGAAAQAKGLTFESSFELGQGYYLGDELRIRQILSNILGNSVKYTSQGRVRFSAKALPNSVLFTISDTGVGMTPEFQKVVFEPYTQATNRSANAVGGVGLGLAIVGELVRHKKGTVTLQSILGQGTTFEIELPLLVSSQSQATDEPLDELPRLDLHVLVVDDNAVNRVVMSAQLKHLGCQVAVAQDGVDALEYLSAHQPDIVLLDCHMPRLDGFEAARQICAAPQQYGTPVLVALTASVDSQAEERCLAAGMKDFMQKPLRFVDLYQRLKDLTS